MSTVPTENVTTQLLTSIQTAIGNIDGIETTNIIVGFDENLESAPDTDFQRVIIVPDENEADDYRSQRDIESSVGFLLSVHLRTAKGTQVRDNGTDMKSMSLYASAVVRALYGFNDLVAAGTPPCDNFLYVNGRYKTTPYYEVFSENVNTSIIEISFRVYSKDINL